MPLTWVFLDPNRSIAALFSALLACQPSLAPDYEAVASEGNVILFQASSSSFHPSFRAI